MLCLPLFFACLTLSFTTSAGQVPTTTSPGPVSAKATDGSGKVPALGIRTQKAESVREVPDTYKGRILTVGSGGGVTGRETAWLLLDDGRLFSQQSGQKSYVFIGRQTAPNTRKVFWSVEDRCAIRKTAYAKPGNMYRFINWKKGTEQHRIVWAPGDKQLPPNYEQVYTGFMGMIPPANR